MRRIQPRSSLKRSSQESRRKRPRINGYIVVANYRGRARQAETSVQLAPVEISAGQSDSFTSMNLVRESSCIHYVSRQVDRGM
jgi:hypothetical protein